MEKKTFEKARKYYPYLILSSLILLTYLKSQSPVIPRPFISECFSKTPFESNSSIYFIQGKNEEPSYGKILNISYSSISIDSKAFTGFDPDTLKFFSDVVLEPTNVSINMGEKDIRLWINTPRNYTEPNVLMGIYENSGQTKPIQITPKTDPDPDFELTKKGTLNFDIPSHMIASYKCIQNDALAGILSSRFGINQDPQTIIWIGGEELSLNPIARNISNNYNPSLSLKNNLNAKN